MFAATRAPSGSNRQPFRFIVLTDGPVAAEAKRIIGSGARRFWEAKRKADGYDEGSGTDQNSPKARMARTMQGYVDDFESVPVLVLGCFVAYRHTSHVDGGSVYPACQNLLLAARALGYGGVMTTWHFAVEGELPAASDPRRHDHHGHHHGGSPGRFPRPGAPRPMSELVYGERWGEAPAWAVDPTGVQHTAAGPPAPPKVEGGRPRHSGRHHMHTLDTPVFDADNHYYEALDAFTRHLDPAHGPRVIQWVDVGGRKYHAVGGRISRAVTNPTFNPISPAGALMDYFRGNPDGRPLHELMGTPEPIRPEYRDRDARLGTMDTQGLSQVWLFPTLGMLYEEALKHDPGAVVLLFRAFNRWLAEDWGMAYRERIFAAPYISLADPDEAVRELEWALDQDARAVVLRAAAPTTITGPYSPSHVMFDPFWARVDEAGITVVVHAGDAGLSSNGYTPDGFAASFKGGQGGASIKMFTIERAAHDFLATLIYERLFDRFPNVRIASVENGSEFLAPLFRKLTGTARKMPGYFKEDPVLTFRRHVWINPFWEDDVNEIVDLMGDDRVIFGSDWPRIEGLPEPTDWVTELQKLDTGSVAKIMGGNTSELNQRQPTATAQ